ncbi:MAG: hypothetical protein C5B53_01040 [Candidatus Melainabacteria bacterium]|nr:MAG: hypothetical protein C5B53_01040 [Candidatus Melainabacteria bacterium]
MKQNLQKTSDPNASVELKQPSELGIKSFPLLPTFVITLLTLAIILIAVMLTTNSGIITQERPRAPAVQSEDKSHAAGTPVQSDAVIPRSVEHETPSDLEHR